MKRVLFSCMTLSILAVTSAFAEGSVNVVTKDYVDAGLRTVYNKANKAQNDVDELTVWVGAPTVDDVPGTGLTGRIEQLEAGAGGGGTHYSAEGLGVSINSGNNIGVSGLTAATGTDGKVYVLQNNSATELELVKSWAIEE